jgi:hypothetical protein
MSNLDLSKAYDAATNVIAAWDEKLCTEWTAEGSAKAAVNAALPHVLNAYAAKYMAFADKATSPSALLGMSVAAQLLTAEAEELNK